jgi:hypothetical protein
MASALWVALGTGCSQNPAPPDAGAGAPAQTAPAQTAAPEQRRDSRTLLAMSPYKEAEQVWAVPPDTKLSKLKKALEAEAASVLPPGDREDRSNLPLWFRVYYRKLHAHADPPIATSGPYQYPRTANRVLQKMIDNPNVDNIEIKN